MPDFIANVGHELPLVLLLLALLGFRRRVRPRASVLIKAPPEKVFALIDFRTGEAQRWQKTRVSSELVSSDPETYRLTFATAMATGSVQSSQALFRVAERVTPSRLDIRRAGLEGQPENSQLMRMVNELTPEAGGTRLRITYEWGPRPMLAQLLARADLWGSAYRIKGLAETGKPDFRTDALISAGVALVTGLVTLWTFAFAFGWVVAIMLVAALLVHEFGHLLAYRLIGQPWGRMVFLPFLGAIAVPRLGFATQGQSVFSAIMGPGLSVIIPLAALPFVIALPPGPGHDIAISIGLVGAALNLFNLLPVEPLDGGIILRSIAARLLGRYAQIGLIAAAVAIVLAGWMAEQVLLIIFGGLALLLNIRIRNIDPGLQPLSRLQVIITLFGFVSVVAAYAVLIRYFLDNVPGGLMTGLGDAYRERLGGGGLKPDPGQERVLAKLEGLAEALAVAQPRGLLARFRKPVSPPRGLYIHGAVGRGKTMLMDLFHAQVDASPKRRVHFHAFMQDVHARLHAVRVTNADAIAPVAKAIAAEARLLCLDEMQITDIADAMIVGRLFEALLAAGTVIVTTSNLAPEGLYKDGLNRQLFLPFIKLLGERLEVVALDGATDYRLGRVKGHETFLTPLGPVTDARLQDLWRRLTDTERGWPMDITVLGRKLTVPQAAHACARFSFADLCEAPLGPPDYLALAANFQTVFVEHIPVLGPERRNAARRFVVLIDTLYDAKVRLVATSAQAPEGISPAGSQPAEFARTVSRLREMQSASWWGKKIAET